MRIIDESNLYMSVQFNRKISLTETHHMFKIQNLWTSLEQCLPVPC